MDIEQFEAEIREFLGTDTAVDVLPHVHGFKAVAKVAAATITVEWWGNAFSPWLVEESTSRYQFNGSGQDLANAWSRRASFA